MTKFMRMCLLVASLMSLLGVMSSSAGAVTWVNDGGHDFTATGGPGTFSGGGLSLSCPGLAATGTVATSPFVGALWSAASGTARYTGCTFSGIPTGFHCNYRLTVVAQTLPVTSGHLDVTCDITQGATKICHIHGATPVHYVNPPDARLILTHSNTLRTTNGTGSCLLGNGTTMTLSQQTWTLTSANPPIITRRP
jgi:hypothetical protein